MHLTIPIHSPIALLFFGLAIITFLLGLTVGTQGMRAHKKNVLKEIAEEKARIESLPKLSKAWLVQIPTELADQIYGPDRLEFARSFGRRLNRLLIFDEEGVAWVGLFMPETLAGLREGEYVQDSYQMPFCGHGEAEPARPVLIDGYAVHVYPIWMKEGTLPPAQHAGGWVKWVELEREFAKAFRGRDYQEVFSRVLPLEKLSEFDVQRTKFKNRCESVGVS